jgi:hypothetical protein
LVTGREGLKEPNYSKETRQTVRFELVATVNFDAVTIDDVHDFLDGLFSEIELPAGYYGFDILTPALEVDE